MTQSGGDAVTGEEPYRVSDTRSRPAAPAPRPPAEPTTEEPATTAAAPRGDGNVRLGLWGATGGGKTTFLAALRIAAEFGGWRMYGVTKRDSDFLQRHWRDLYEDQKFPDSTAIGDPITYHWLLNGDPGAGEGRWRLRRPKPVQFVLEMQDISGVIFKAGTDDTGTVEARIRRELFRHMADSDGLVYLFDPMRDLTASRSDRNIGYMQGVIEQLEAQLGPAGRLVDGRLPHSLAVCVSKFDDPAIFNQAYKQGWVNFGTDGPVPRVLDEHAKAFFHEFICSELKVESAALLRRLIDNHFVPERVRYFVTSSIGFYLRDGEFDDLDFSNVVAEGDSLRIRDEIRPINVLEPLVHLERRVRTGRW